MFRKLIVVALLFAAVTFIATPAEAAPGRVSESPGGVALSWAETQAGKPYYYGGTGPWSYDCSGLVYAAFRHIGITLPRTTYEMLSSAHLQWISASQAVRGDLAFYGSGHVEFVTAWAQTTFGAHDWGQPVGWIRYSEWWHPTAFYRVVP